MKFTSPFHIRMSVGTKLLLGVIFIVLILGTFGLYLSNTATNVRNSFSELDTRYGALREITSVENIHSIQSDATKSYVLTQDESWVDVYDSASLEFDLRIAELEKLLEGTKRGEILEDFVAISDRLRATELLILSKVREGDVAGAEEIFANDYPDLQLESLNMLSVMRSEMESGVSEIIQQNKVLLLFTENILISFIVVLIIIITAVSLLLSFSISSSIRELNETVEAINDGDLSRRARVRSRDEIGRLAMAFNKMTQKLSDSYSGLEEKVENKTAQLRKNVGELEKSKHALMDVMEDLEGEKNHLAISKARDEAILESIGDGMLVLNQEGKVQFMNNAAAELLGCQNNACMGKLIDQVILTLGPDDEELPREQWPCYMVLKDGAKVSTSDYSFKRSDGRIIPVAMTGNPIVFNEHSIGVVVIFRDISHEKEVDKAKTEFVSLASHQLRGPLTSIKWIAELLLEDKTLSKSQQEFVSDLLQSNDHMIELVNKLLNISRIEKGTYMVDPVRSDLREIADSILRDFVAQTEEKQLKIKRNYPKVFAPVNVDPNLTRIMYQNLISNAIKYSNSGGVLTVAFTKKDDQVVFSVQDNGIGIPKQDQEHIFEKLFRAKNATDHEIRGNGLGLYMVKEIAERSGGKIWFESEEGKGTVFHVSIPLAGMQSRKGSKTLM